jgi:hypothetical protein
MEVVSGTLNGVRIVGGASNRVDPRKPRHWLHLRTCHQHMPACPTIASGTFEHAQVLTQIAHPPEARTFRTCLLVTHTHHS